MSFMDDVSRPRGGLALALKVAALAAVALPLLPLQLLSHRLGLPTARTLPLFFHRAAPASSVCA